MSTAREQYLAMAEEAARRSRSVRALPVGSPERAAAIAGLEVWRNETMRPEMERLWPEVVADGEGYAP